MRIIKRQSEYDRLIHLMEYDITKGKVMEDDDITPEEEDEDLFKDISSLVDDDDVDDEHPTNTSFEPQEEEPIENKADVDVDTGDNQSFDDNVTDLLKIHSSKIEKLMNYMNDAVDGLNGLNSKQTDAITNIEQIHTKLSEIGKRVDVLTPPTPLESLNKQIDITTGANSIEDFWRDYFQKKGLDASQIPPSISYNNSKFNQNEKGMTSATYKAPSISDNQIKNIIRNS